MEEKAILDELIKRQQRKANRLQWKRQYDSMPPEYQRKADEAGETPDDHNSSMQSDEVLENVELDFKNRNDPNLHPDYPYLARQVRENDFRC